MNLKDIWKNKTQILEGLKNNLFKKEHIEELYEQRLEICKGCKFFDTKGDNCNVKGTQPCCGHCGCSIGLKLRCLSCECPIKKWEAILTKKEEEKFADKLY